jgi:hypothetical protein
MWLEVDAPRSVGGVIDRTLRAYRRGLRPLLQIYLLFALIAAIPISQLPAQRGG